MNALEYLDALNLSVRFYCYSARILQTILFKHCVQYKKEALLTCVLGDTFSAIERHERVEGFQLRRCAADEHILNTEIRRGLFL